MFEATFLGHQGWLFTSGDTRLLVDPLLRESFCDAGKVGRVFPPRRFDFERFPAVDAVFFSHEHDDHFAIATLQRLERRIPVFLSSRSSQAARSILGELGFRVSLLEPGRGATLGSLSLYAFSPDHLAHDNFDEWDVLPYLVFDRAGDGSFFSHVDVEPNGRAELAARKLIERPGLFCWSNNAGNWSFMQGGPRPALLDSAKVAEIVHRHYLGLKNGFGVPALVLCSGGGMSFDGSRQWLNRNVFSADSNQICEGLSALAPETRFLAPLPGQAFRMDGGALTSITEQSEFLCAAPKSAWPARDFAGDVALMERYEPASGRTDFEEKDLDELQRELDDFAAFLYGTRTFRELYSCDSAELGERRPSFALVLLADSAFRAYVFEYQPHACRFAPVKSRKPAHEYVAGMELWATDFLAICRGELGPHAIPFGRGRVWKAGGRLHASFRDFCLYFHPLRRPARFLRLYRRLLDQADGAPPLVRSSRHIH